MTSKTQTSRSGGSTSATLETIPESIAIEILKKLDFQSLCSTAAVSRSLHSSASNVLASLSSLDLSAFSPDVSTVDGVFSKLKELKCVTLDCLRLNDCSVTKILRPSIQELNLYKGASLSDHLLVSVGKKCPDLRVLLLELTCQEEFPETLKQNLVKMLRSSNYLECLALKTRGTTFYINDLQLAEVFMPTTLRTLKLQTIYEHDAVGFIRKLKQVGSVREPQTNVGHLLYPCPAHFRLQSLSLVLNVISDELVMSIVDTFPLLVELDLEDRPSAEPIMPHDLSNHGLQSLGACQHLTALSIVRSRQNYPASFKRINDMGMFLLSEGCRSLKSVKLGGFSKVTDSGFSELLRSCPDLEKFEVRSATQLSDLAFHDMRRVVSSLLELRILGCNLITSEAVHQLASSRILEVLDFSGCRSIANACLNYISGIQTLTSLNLSGAADVTDNGLSVLSKANLPITRLCLRGCKRISDKGIAHLLRDGGRIRKTLQSLDLGHMPGITDAAISVIASAGQAVTELCIRSCFYVTDASLETLASEIRFQNRVLRKLDLYHCPRLTDKSLAQLQKQPFHSLRWLGVGFTSLASDRDNFAALCNARPWLTVCFDGCEVGCHDGWQFHRFIPKKQ